jgi:hypothetical protein
VNRLASCMIWRWEVKVTTQQHNSQVWPFAEAGALGACEHTCVNVLVGMCESVRVCVCKVCVCVCVCAESLCLSACVL